MYGIHASRDLQAQLVAVRPQSLGGPQAHHAPSPSDLPKAKLGLSELLPSPQSCLEGQHRKLLALAGFTP